MSSRSRIDLYRLIEYIKGERQPLCMHKHYTIYQIRVNSSCDLVFVKILSAVHVWVNICFPVVVLSPWHDLPAAIYGAVY